MADHPQIALFAKSNSESLSTHRFFLSRYCRRSGKRTIVCFGDVPHRLSRGFTGAAVRPSPGRRPSHVYAAHVEATLRTS
jgi:hypothetical protein